MAWKLDPIAVMKNIDSAREQFYACTVRDLSRLMRVNEASLRLTIAGLLEDGMVAHTAWTGSLHVTDVGRAAIQVVDVLDDEADEAEVAYESPDDEPAPLAAADGEEQATETGEDAEPQSEVTPSEEPSVPRKRAPRTKR